MIRPTLVSAEHLGDTLDSLAISVEREATMKQALDSHERAFKVRTEVALRSRRTEKPSATSLRT